jgi:tRNA threonylcarbamoyladenosine biosynthesis protein TsaE
MEFLKFMVTMSEKERRTIMTSHSPQETIAIGRQIAATLKLGDVVYLFGDLGSGKTVFVKGICQGLGVKEEVTSPSFVIATEYKGRMPISHIDLYRLDQKNAAALPVDEYFLENGITIIEWADRINIKNGLRVKFDIKGVNTREIIIEDFRD